LGGSVAAHVGWFQMAALRPPGTGLWRTRRRGCHRPQFYPCFRCWIIGNRI